MVAYGYILPKKNIDLRLKNLELGLKNQELKNINAKLNLSLYTPLTLSSNVPTITQQTGEIAKTSLEPTIASLQNLENKKSSAQFINATIPLNEMLREKASVEQTISGLVKNVEKAIQQPKAIQPKALIDELKQKIESRKNIEFPAIELPKREKRVEPVFIEMRQYIKAKKEGGLTMKDQQNIKKKMENVLNQIDKENEMKNAVKNLSSIIEDEKNIQTEEALYNIFNDVVKNNELALMALEDVNIPTLSNIPLTPSQAPTTGTLWSRLSVDTGDFENLPDVVKEAKGYINKFRSDIKTYDEFKKHVQRYRKRLNTGLQDRLAKESWYPLPISAKENLKSTKVGDKTLQQSWSYYKNSKNNFIERLDKRLEAELSSLIRSPPQSPQVTGNGLSGGEVKSHYYSSYNPNFGNLHLMEHSLKKNQLTIYRPYSKITMVSKTNISPLLKKMILDIQNTLEFDERDYQNLEGDEKRVIERIIRSQKDMKNYNIKALIDEDDAKIKKRLEILVGQINAGNASSLVKQEMKALLKKLYDNKAISLTKYTTSLKSIKALG